MKSLKHFDRLENHNDILYRKFYDHTDCNVIRQYVVPLHMQEEVLYRVHKSKNAGHCGIAKTATFFRQYFYFPNSVEFLTDYIKTALLVFKSNLSNTQHSNHRSYHYLLTNVFLESFCRLTFRKLPESAGFSSF